MALIKISEQDIKDAETLLGFELPIDLKNFYLKHGYGTIESKGYNTNLIMHPVTAANFRLKREEFENFPDIDIYDKYNEKQFVFFEANESLFIAIDFKTGEIFADDIKIADSVEDFLDKITNDENFYIQK